MAGVNAVFSGFSVELLMTDSLGASFIGGYMQSTCSSVLEFSSLSCIS